MNETYNSAMILNGLEGSFFSKNLVVCDIIGSTNTLAKELAQKGAPHGTVVLTEEQTEGRGRLDRNWLSRTHENLLFTILLRPVLDPDRMFTLTMIMAISAIDAVWETAGVGALIKWPNDIYVNRKKLAGILTEFFIRAGSVEYVIIGMGLNANWMPGEEDGLLYPATSILNESGRRVLRHELLIDILKRFEIHYQKVMSGNIEDIHERWNELSLVIGKDVQVISPEEVIKGRVLSIDREGALILKDTQDKEVKILSGDVSLRF